MNQPADGSGQPQQAYAPTPQRRDRTVLIAVAAGVLLFAAAITLMLVLTDSEPDWTGQERQFLTAQTSSLDDDDAVRYAHAVCDMIDAGGEQLTIEWLAGEDAISQAGYVKPNPEPISMYDARQIVHAADAHLCA